jgi:hypothetical protein
MQDWIDVPPEQHLHRLTASSVARCAILLGLCSGLLLLLTAWSVVSE